MMRLIAFAPLGMLLPLPEATVVDRLVFVAVMLMLIVFVLRRLAAEKGN